MSEQEESIESSSSSSNNINGQSIPSFADFKITISIPPDNPPISQVDQSGLEYHAVQPNSEGRFVQVLNQIKQQEYLQSLIDKKKVNKDESKDEADSLQAAANPMAEFTDHMNLARIELEQMIFLIDMIRTEKHITLASTDKPPPSENRELCETVQKVSLKQKALSDMANRLTQGAARMKSTVATASSWWGDVSTLRSKWRLKGKESAGSMMAPLGAIKSNSKRLSIDYGSYTSGSFVEQTEADLSRNAKGEISISFPNLSTQSAINKRLYIKVKARDSKTFSNNSSQSIVRLPATDHSKSYREFEQLLQRIDTLSVDEARKLSFLKCSNLLNKAQKYQFHSELFEALAKEAALGTTGEIVMQTEKEIRIDCGGLNLYVGMESRSDAGGVDDDTDESMDTDKATPTTTTTPSNKLQLGGKCVYNGQTSAASSGVNPDDVNNRLLFVVKMALKKMSTLQLRRSQKQLLLNPNNRNPKIVFGRKHTSSFNDDLISKTASILRHLDMFLRVSTVIDIIEQRLPVRAKYISAGSLSSSLIVLSLIKSAQLSRAMVAIEVEVNQNQVMVVQGQSKSTINDEKLVGCFIVNLIQSYFVEEMSVSGSTLLEISASSALALSTSSSSSSNKTLTSTKKKHKGMNGYMSKQITNNSPAHKHDVEHNNNNNRR
ncbi:hypothetical protein SAMD00019534_097830 [Acytostelium subglobosum LB1]|uniref:hypothetical protein n=1 Tax=Acytostelium subglobosum LB1 TaxID=1410327 RepID=UPI0006450DD9|nr:hypothetical protein SAMD00019534_097830 [Acytostelium subglobosum LB1]GAM26608.1 hypothetical protein SAMD00019534_097830 [Acytostelium subglobosum LB1]|eukprot:XP_012750269.1 hypothetical protein SAMD00019534_097830 [Acytostelium subglobosum LB1]